MFEGVLINMLNKKTIIILNILLIIFTIRSNHGNLIKNILINLIVFDIYIAALKYSEDKF
jgi:hypothetical protein